ncbi:MAG: prenyltransferase [Thermoplasmata archaeon]|nr:MAG: prenyltransferase [Thermoplasmata archaeon]
MKELRAPFLIAVIIPTFLGALIAATEIGDDFNFSYFLLTLVGIICIHLGANVSNDYFDYKSGADVNNPYRTPFSGGSGLLSDTDKKLLKPKHVLIVAFGFYGIGCSIGLLLDFLLGDPLHFILLIGLAGVGLSFFYTAPPFKFSYRGLGELAVATTFGPFVVIGSYYVQTVQLSWDPLLASLPLAALIAAILYINEFPDHFVDKRAGKRQLVVRVGVERAVRGYLGLVAFAFISILFGIAIGFFDLNLGIQGIPLAAAATLVAIPIALKTSDILKKNYNSPLKLIPASANTLLLYSLVGILLCVAYAVRLF